MRYSQKMYFEFFNVCIKHFAFYAYEDTDADTNAPKCIQDDDYEIIEFY